MNNISFNQEVLKSMSLQDFLKLYEPKAKHPEYTPEKLTAIWNKANEKTTYNATGGNATATTGGAGANTASGPGSNTDKITGNKQPGS